MVSRFASYFMALLSGALLVAALPPFNIWPLFFIGLSLFYRVLAGANTNLQAIFLGWVFGFGYFCFGLSWISNALLVDGNDYIWAYPLALVALPAALSCFYALASGIVYRYSDMHKLSGYIFFSVVFMATEYARGHIFTGFPWNLFGTIWSDKLEIAQIASIGGIYFLSLATCIWASLWGFLSVWQQKTSWKALLAILCVLDISGAYIYGANKLKESSTELRTDIAIRLVQPNIAQHDKWNPEKTQENLSTLLDLSEPEHGSAYIPTLIIWPETALSQYIYNHASVRAALKATIASYSKGAVLASGYMRYEQEPQKEKIFFNSLSLFHAQSSTTENFDKRHLVPFGEYMPFKNYLSFTPLAHYSGFQAGKSPKLAQISISGTNISFLPLICYEIIFPSLSMPPNGKRPDFILNVTNDAWYGDSIGPRQHFIMAQFRAIEQGVPAIRVANTGISGVFDSVGRLRHIIALGQRSGNDISLPLISQKPTLYPILKDRLFIGFLILGLLLSYILQRLKRRS